MKEINTKTECCLQDCEALLEAASRLIEGEETQLALSLVYQALEKIRNL